MPIITEETRYQLLRHLEANPAATQRELAGGLGGFPWASSIIALRPWWTAEAGYKVLGLDIDPGEYRQKVLSGVTEN